MANKRMFSIDFVNSDSFLEMPLSTQALYFHLGMRADDDGFVGNPKSIVRLTGCKEDDVKILLAKHYIYAFESGVIVIKHWKSNNYIKGDRYKPTNYKNEKQQLRYDENGNYTLDTIKNALDTPFCPNCLPSGDKVETQVRLDKVSIDNENNKLFSCTELKNSTQCSYKLPLNDGTYFPILETDIKHWQELYQAINVDLEIRKMLGWLEANPKNRKTKTGIKRFINLWLSKAQDKAPRGSNYTTSVMKENPIDAENGGFEEA